MSALPSHRTLTRPLAIAALAIGSACASAAAEPVSAAIDKRSNVLILFSDDQRSDTIHAWGNDEIQTPNLDRLAARGMSFPNTYVMGSLHGAVCMPSRAMLLTGRHYFNLPLSVTSTWSVPAAERGALPYVTFPELFRDAGYETFGTGKWHNGKTLYGRAFTDGDAIFFGGMSDHLAVPVYEFDPEGVYAGKAHTGEEFSSELFSSAAIEFLKQRDPDRPFLLYLSYTAPHDPRMAPAEYAQLYEANEIELPANFMSEHPFPIGDLRVRDEKLAPFPRTPEVVREHIAAYYAMISHLDAQIGRVLDVLAKTGEFENTIVVFTGDNGLAVGQHGLLGKQNIYEHSARVPMIIAGPGIQAGARSEALCYIHDIFPTMCDMTNLPVPDSVQSLSLAPVLEDQQQSVRDSLLVSYSTPASEGEERHKTTRRYLRGVRQGDFKLIESHYDGEVTLQLFNLARDPWELRNLADDAGHANRLRRMQRLLADWRERAGDFID